MKLDVGCGKFNSTHAGEHKFFQQEDMIHLDIEKHAYHNDIQGTVYNLPFADKTFKVCYLRHVLEHLENPIMALKELKRVSELVIIQVPNASYSKFKLEHEEHLFSWNYSTLNNLLAKVFDNFEVFTSKRYNANRTYLKKIVFAIACLFLKENELTAICYS